MKGLRIITFLSLATLAAGCTRVQPDGLDERTEIVSVSLEGSGPQTRVCFGEDGTLAWNGDMAWSQAHNYNVDFGYADQVDVHVSSSNVYRTCVVDGANQRISLSLSGSEARDGFAIYPAGYVQNNSTEAVTIQYPTEYHPLSSDLIADVQEFVDNDRNITLGHVRIPMIAVNRPDGALAFKHVGGMLAFHFHFWDRETGDYLLESSVGRIRIILGGDKMAGVATIANPSSANPTATIASGAGQNYVDIYLDGDNDFFKLGRGDFIDGEQFISIPVPCGTYNGMTIRLYDSSDHELGAYADENVRVIGRCQAWAFGDPFYTNFDGRVPSYERGFVFNAFKLDHIGFTTEDDDLQDSAGSIFMAPGQTKSLTGTLYASNANGELPAYYSPNDPHLITTIAPVKYYSRNTAVATVNENTGAVTAVAPGVAAIYATATYLNKTVTSADCNVHVTSGFSVAANKKVFIAPGNLKYVNGKYSFHEHGYMTVLPTSGAVIGSQSADAILNGNHDLFYWSQLAPFNNDFLGGWRILTNDEWRYLFVTRNNASSKFGYCMINDSSIPGIDTNRGVLGLVLLPDEFTDPLKNEASQSGAFAGGGNANAGSHINDYDLDGWLAMEAAGAVFLPYHMYGDHAANTAEPVVQTDALYYFSVEGYIHGAGETGGWRPTDVGYNDNKPTYYNNYDKAIFTRLVRDIN